MDTLETYIKMRLTAIPDMGMGTPMGFSINWQSEAILIDEKGDWYYSTKDEAVQLERQDQLQEMVLPNPNKKDAWGEPFEDDLKTDHVFWLFLDFSKTLQERKRSQQTGEQLWLRYVMKKKYNKTWDGEKWITE